MLEEEKTIGPTRRLVEFVSMLEYDSLPPDVINKAKQCVLDNVGVQLVASTLPWSRIAYSTLKGLGGVPESTIVNYGDTVPAAHAAFVNGTFGHGCEFDDMGTLHGRGHPGTVNVPTGIALGEKVHATGEDLIAAVVAGYEVMGRVAFSVPSMEDRGFHGPGYIFGPVVVAARLLNMNTNHLTNAIGIAGSFAGGLGQFAVSGGEVKRLHAGKAAYGGILSALLAKGGFTAPPDVLEGESGFLKAFTNVYDLETLTRGLGEEWLIREAGFKLYPCGGGLHSTMETVSRMAEANNFVAQDAERIIIKCSPFFEFKFGRIYEPYDTTTAQLSVPFGVALTLVKGLDGVDLAAFTDEAVWKDPKIVSNARKVSFEIDRPNKGTTPNRFNQTVVLTLKDGRRFEEKNQPPKGTPPREPLSWPEVAHKFEKNARSVLPNSQVEFLVETIDKLEKLPDVSELTSHLKA